MRPQAATRSDTARHQGKVRVRDRVDGRPSFAVVVAVAGAGAWAGAVIMTVAVAVAVTVAVAVAAAVAETKPVRRGRARRK